MKLAAHVTYHLSLSYIYRPHVRIDVPTSRLESTLNPFLDQELLLYLSVLQGVFVKKGLIILHEGVKLLLFEASETVHDPFVYLLGLLVEQVLEVQIINFVWNRQFFMNFR